MGLGGGHGKLSRGRRMIARDQKRPNKLFGAWISSGIRRLRLAEGAVDLGASAGLDQLGASQPISWRFSGAFFFWGQTPGPCQPCIAVLIQGKIRPSAC